MPLKFLVVDDSDDDVQILRLNLRSGGIDATLERVDSLPALQAALSQSGWDLALTDFRIQAGFTGFEALACIRTHAPDLPVLVVSGTIGEERAAALMKAGANDFINKDNLARLVPTIEREMNDAAARRQHQALQSRYRRMVELAYEGVAVSDADGRLVFVNHRLAEMFGCDEADLLGRTTWDLAFDDHREAQRKRFLQRREGIREQAEVRFRRLDGGEVWALLKAAPMVDDHGRYEGGLVMFSDVTERRRAEAAGALSAEREKAAMAEAARATELARVRTMIVHWVSHELRSPLTVLLGCSELLQDRFGADADSRDLWAELRSSAGAIHRLVDDLLDFVASELGTLNLNRQQVDASAQVRAVLGSLRFKADAAGVGLDVRAPDHPVPADLDPQRVAQVLNNLVGNALKVSSHGARVEVRLRVAGASLRYEVEDRGGGIAPADVSRLFQAFSQLEAGRARGGLGLGLAISKAIVEAHGGAIGVDSAIGRGSTFWFTIPLSPA